MNRDDAKSYFHGAVNQGLYRRMSRYDEAMQRDMQRNGLGVSVGCSVSDGSTASYYELPEGATELQDLISYKNLNAQIGEIMRSCYRYGQASHSEKLRDAKKMKFYAEAEIERLEKYGE